MAFIIVKCIKFDSLFSSSSKLITLFQNNDRIRIVTIGRKSSRVEISSASIDDSGEYQCIVNNLAGSVNHSFIIELMQGKSTGIDILRVEATCHGTLCTHTHTHILYECMHKNAHKIITHTHTHTHINILLH